MPFIRVYYIEFPIIIRGFPSEIRYFLVPSWSFRPGSGHSEAAWSGLGLVLALAPGVAWALFHVGRGPNRSLAMTPSPT